MIGIRDVSQEIAEEHSISKKDVENVFEFFYQTSLKEQLSKFKSDEIGFKNFGTFKLNYRHLPMLSPYCDRKLETYTEEFDKLKEESPEEDYTQNWKYKYLLLYTEIVENLKKIQEKRKEKEVIKITKRQLRQYELDRETEENKQE